MKTPQLLLALAPLAIFAQGCGKASNDAQAPNAVSQNNPLVSADTQAAVILADLSYKYGFDERARTEHASASESMNERGNDRNRRRPPQINGCAMAAEFVTAVPQVDLPASVASYCAFLAAQNISVRDCGRAQDLAVQLIEDAYDLDEDCNDGRQHARRPSRRPGRGRGDRDIIRQTRAILEAAQDYRQSLGFDR